MYILITIVSNNKTNGKNEASHSKLFEIFLYGVKLWQYACVGCTAKKQKVVSFKEQMQLVTVENLELSLRSRVVLKLVMSGNCH